jgi:hypothetical protein
MGVGGYRHTPIEFIPWKDTVPIVQEAGLAPGPVWIDVEYLTPPGFYSRTVQLVGSSYSDWATGPTRKVQFVRVNWYLSSIDVFTDITVTACILIAVYVFLLFVHVLLTSSMYSYCCLCILIDVYVFLLFVHVFLAFAMYSYCCLRILRRGYPDWGFSVLFPQL